MRFPRQARVGLLLVLGVLVAACGSSSGGTTAGANPGAGASGSAAPKPGKVTIAAFNFGESQILANLYKGVLEKAGYSVEVKALTNREAVEPALERGDVDVVPEYIGTLTEFLNKKANGPSAAPKASSSVDDTLAALRSLAQARGLAVLMPSLAADQNAFAVTQDYAQKNNLQKLSDLTGKSPLVLGGPPECPQRPFCQPGLERVYGLKFSKFVPLDAGGPLTKQAIKSGKVDIGLVFSSDGGIDALGLKVLDDDKGLQSVDNIAPVANKDVVTDAFTKALGTVSSTLTTDDLVKLNRKVDVDRQDAAKVAEQYLKDKNLV